MPYEPGCGMSIDQPHFEPPEPARELVPESAPEPVIGRRAEIARYALRLCKSSAWPSTPPPRTLAEHCTTPPPLDQQRIGAPVPPMFRLNGLFHNP